MTLAILTACACALFAWAVQSFFRAHPRLTPRERAWAKLLGVPNAKTRAELEHVVCPKLTVGMDLSTKGDRAVHALARISPESAREHVHVFEDADWSDGVEVTTRDEARRRTERDAFEESPSSSARMHSVRRDAAGNVVSIRSMSDFGISPDDEVTAVTSIAGPVKR